MSDGDIPRRTADGYRRSSGPADERLKSAAEAAVAGEKSGPDPETAAAWRARLDKEATDREAAVAGAAAASSSARSHSTLSGQAPAERDPAAPQRSDSSSKVWILVAAAIGVCFAVGLMLALRPGDNGSTAEQIASDDAVEINIATSAPATTAPATTEAPATTAAPSTQPPTTPAPVAAAVPSAQTQTGQGDAGPSRPAPTAPPTPANLSVVYPHNSAGDMTLLEGSTAAVVVNNSGGQPGSYSVGASGAVTLGSGASGTVPPGGSAQVAIVANTGVTGGGPHATVTVSIGAEALSIDVYIT